MLVSICSCEETELLLIRRLSLTISRCSTILGGRDLEIISYHGTETASKCFVVELSLIVLCYVCLRQVLLQIVVVNYMTKQ